ncbi:TIGR03086 family metal-binding protein [Gordonia bronchialis]|nr:TIGR03086 family metal-binding protein [Gordonia bronchialis]
MTMRDEATRLAEALDGFVAVVDVLDDCDWPRPSRCAGWSVADVVGHIIAVTDKFTSFARAETDTPRTAPAPRGDPAPLRRALAESVAASADAWPSCDGSRRCRLPFGTFSAVQAASINMMDALVHAWDIAAANGIDYRMPSRAIGPAIVIARRLVTPEAVAGGQYASGHLLPEPAADAEALLLRLTGRDPATGPRR